MRPGKPSDLRALRVVMKRLVREGIVNCVPNAAWFQRMLGDLEVGNDLQWLAGGAAGITILVPEMAMSGS